MEKDTRKKEKKETLGINGSSQSILMAPWITEAATAAMELNKYTFKVDPRATKGQVKREIEDLYKVSVVSINTVTISRKFRNYGKTPGFRPGFKKAIVTVKEGEKIELFKGV